MSIEWFWLLGLLAIGVVTAIMARSVRIHFNTDQRVVRNILIWGAVLATGWVFYGGIMVFLLKLAK